MTLEQTAREALEAMRRRAPEGVELELYLSASEERSIDLRDGRLDGIQSAASEGAGLRVVREGRMAFASAGRADVEAAVGLLPRALEQLPHLEAEEHRALPEGKAAAPSPELAASLWDDELFATDWKRIQPRLEALGDRIRRGDRRISSVLRAGYSESRGEVVIASTRGVFTRERGCSASVGASALCEEDDELQVGSAYQSARRCGALDFDRVADDAAQRTAALLGARKLSGGRRSVVFDPWVAGEFLDLIAGLLCADQVQRGKSLLAGKLGRKVGSPLVTFVDDPRRLGGMASALFDDEGCPTAAKTMIEGGVVREFFYDAYTASRDGRSTNASAGRGSYRGTPSPGPTNFYLAPGPSSRDEIIRSTEDGVLVLDVMGMHMADPVSGEFSVGVSGLSISKGELSHAVRGAMVSGNLLELLDRVDAVGGDLTFYGAMGAPTFRVADLTVA